MQKSKQFLQFLKSLKFRLILLIVVIAVVPSLILSAAVLKYYEKRAVSIRESEILSQAKILANQIATSEYMKLGADVSSSNIQTQIDMLTTIYDGRVIVVDDNCKVYYDTYNLCLLYTSNTLFKCHGYIFAFVRSFLRGNTKNQKMIIIWLVCRILQLKSFMADMP